MRKTQLCKKRILALALIVSMFFTSVDANVLATQTDVNSVSDEDNLIPETSEDEELESEERTMGEIGDNQSKESIEGTDNSVKDDYIKETDDIVGENVNTENSVNSERTDEVGKDDEADKTEEVNDNTLPNYSDDESNIASGTYENITWLIDNNGKLMVNGTGEFAASTER